MDVRASEAGDKEELVVPRMEEGEGEAMHTTMA